MGLNVLIYKMRTELLPRTIVILYVIMYVKVPRAVLFEGINNSFPPTQDEYDLYERNVTYINHDL